ncbi:LacI family DNA-binding transcriptional regulator [Gallaecimonas sp. GXIMD1310]|uniref:LacI family DNA-binding transcriptional regulator n=1 Tax=Gallaecimonas sp. GXIMD1310 TaxID=3131926 RepID=UPI003253E8A0
MNSKVVKTLADLAALAGVSESTASRALRDNPLINENTRRRVQQLAREQNFRINASARNLRLQKTNTVAVIIVFDASSSQAISDPFLLAMLGTLADELSQRGYDMLLTTTRSGTSTTPYMDAQRADGLIVIGQGEQEARIRELHLEQVPFVVWGANAPDLGYSVVGSNNSKGGQLAARHLLEQGCQRLLFLGNIHHLEIRQRWQGFLQSAPQAAQHDCDFTSAAGHSVTAALFADGQRPYDGILAASDTIGVGAIKALNEAGIAIPQDVAIVGFDDMAIAEYAYPALSSVRQDVAGGGRQLVESLLARMAGQEPASIELDVSLVTRASSLRQQ